MTLTLEQIANHIAEDKARIPPLYGPESSQPDEDFADSASEARRAVAEAEDAVSTLYGYLRDRPRVGEQP